MEEDAIIEANEKLNNPDKNEVNGSLSWTSCNECEWKSKKDSLMQCKTI